MTRRALVTGGSAGLGGALAAELAGAGFTVVSVDRTPPDHTGGVVHVECDLARREAVDRALPAILAAGPYDHLFFNAGANATGAFAGLPAETAARLMTLNAETPMVLASMLVREDAVRSGMCFVSSLSHFTGYPGAAAYAASKDALAVYAKSIRRPFGRRGISVTLACPGPLRTEHARRHAPEGADEARRMPPEVAARAIVAAALAGRRLVIPGAGPKLFALAGVLFPAITARQMRRLVYEKLGGPVW